ncbi:MAG: HlyD family efflux transporter periplasmic adaptor subunit [Clostridium sp.]|uniref:HlyD family secretion protein n=1 Tax=Clostridium sp. TaxID=1506 RepID=UPI00290C0EE9|nr:HlyD family efflux transporter periplasmic adaptor subunit [Clostridium sp.]MDU4939766.1 HlyD family efflux transporter periplasmic adaptor subunit [Clostridium sp.]
MKVYNLNEITDSKIQYDKKPPAFMFYIIGVVATLLIIAIIWACNSVKTYVVKGQGLVVSKNKSYIMSKISGEITEVYVSEGSVVSKGDVLFKTNGMESNLQLDQINSQISVYCNRIDLLKRAEDDAKKGKNSFNKKNETESEFYNRLSAAYLSRKEYEVDDKSLKQQGYEQSQIDEYVQAQNNKKNEHYYKTIAEFTNERVQYEVELEKLKSQKDAIQKGTEQYVVTAQNDGIIHLNTPLSSGMVIQGGSLIGTIISEEDELLIEAMLSSSDRPRIHTGDEVSLAIGGLNQAEYGTLSGEVISIDEDATIDNEQGNIYFKVMIKPEKNYIEDSKGEKVNLIVGMVTESRVKYERITYMKYLLELIGVKFS